MLKNIFLLISLSVISQVSIFSQNRVVQLSAENQFDQALELFNDKQYNAAQFQFDAYLKRDKQAAIKTPLAAYYSALTSVYLFQEDGENRIKQFVKDYADHPKAQEAYFNLGNFYYREKNYAKAIQYYTLTETAILNTEDYLDYQFRIGYSYFSRKAFTEALPAFTYLKKKANTYQSAAYYYSAYVNYELGNYDEALKDINQAVNNEAYASSAAEIRASIYYKQNKYQEVIAYIKSLNDAKLSPGTVLIAADTYFALAQYDLAWEYFERYQRVVKSITERPILYRIGFSAYKTNHSEQAIDYFEKVGIKQDTLTQYSTYYLGNLYQSKGNNRFAINAFQQAKSNSFDKKLKEESHWQLAVLLIKEVSYQEAIKELTTFIEAYPNSNHANEAKEYLTNAYLNTQAYGLAIGFIESLPNLTPKLKLAYQKVTFYQGADYFNKADYYQAVNAFKKSVDYPLDKSINAAAYFWMGEAYATGRKYADAIKAYEKAIPLTSTSDNWYPALCYGIAYSYYNTKQYYPALDFYVKYLNQKQDNTYRLDALVRLADCYYVTKQYDKAVENYKQAFNSGGTLVKDYSLFQLGIVSSFQNNDKQAINYFDQLIKDFPQSSYYDNALFQKALITFESGNYETSVKQFSNMLEKVPQSNLVPHALSKRAIAYFNLKQYELALVDYRHILRAYLTHPTASGALIGLQEIYGIKNIDGDFEEFLSKYKTANPADKEVATIEYEAAKSLYFNQNYEKAITAFKNYIENYPGNKLNQEATYYLADSYYRAKAYEKALPIFYKVIQDEQSLFYKRAISKVAEIELILQDYDKSQSNYNKLLSLAENTRDKYNAWEGLLQIAILRNNYKQIIEYADLIVSQGNINTTAITSAYVQKGMAYFNQGMYEPASKAFNNAIATAKDENAARSKYMLALMQYNEQQYKQSLEILFELNKQFADYSLWLGKSFLLIADNYYASGELFQAKATLNSIIQNSDNQSLVNEANIKLELILAEESKKAKQDSLELLKNSDSITISTDSIND